MPKAGNVSFGGATKGDIERRRRMAEMLREQGKQPEGTQMVSGWAVPQSPLAGLAKALQTGIAGYQDRKADELEAQKNEAAKQNMIDAAGAYSRAMDTTPTQLKSGETINWNADPQKAGNAYANILLQNEDTAPLGMQAQVNNMQNTLDQQRLKQQQDFQIQMFERQAALQNQITPYQQAQLDLQRYALDQKESGITPYQQAQLDLEKQKFDFQKSMKGAVNPLTGEIEPVRKLTATEQKEVFDLQDKQAAVDSALSALNEAKDIYSRTPESGQPMPYTGWGAETMAAMSRVPIVGGLVSDPERGAETTKAKNIVTQQALDSLKASFGGNPTEGERKVQLELQALPSYTPQEQAAILDRAIALAARRQENFATRLGQIEGGNYFTPNMQNTPNNAQNIGPQGQESNPALTTQPYDQIQPLLRDNAQAQTSFNSIEEAEAANLPVGTVIMIGGRRAVVE